MSLRRRFNADLTNDARRRDSGHRGTLTLKEKFDHFLRNIPGAEAIDDLVLTSPQQNSKKADFFFRSRSIIGEVKSLQADATPKITRLVQEAQRDYRVPLYWAGTVCLSRLLEPFPEKVEHRVITSICAPVRAAFKDAHRQIRTTKVTFGLPKSGGLLILESEKLPSLSPRLVAWSVNQMLRTRTETGGLRYPEISVVWMVVEESVVRLEHGRRAFQSFKMCQENAPVPNVEEFTERLQTRWLLEHGITANAERASAPS